MEGITLAAMGLWGMEILCMVLFRLFKERKRLLLSAGEGLAVCAILVSLTAGFAYRRIGLFLLISGCILLGEGKR